MTETERTAAEDRLAAMSDADLRDLMVKGSAGGEEADLIAGEAERRNIDF